MAGNYEAILDVDDPIDTPEAQLEFQNFVLSTAEQNLVSGKVSTPRAAPPPTSGTDYGFAPPQPRAPQVTGGFWTIEFYAQYFDVDSTEVGQRMLASIFPKQNFLQVIGEKPDLYGPFWISTSVIFALFVTSTVAGSMAAWLNDQKGYTWKLDGLSTAVAAIYIYATALPALVWGIGRYFSVPMNLLQIVDVFGYGLTIWIPVSLLCIIPLDLMRWVLVLIAFVVSVLFQTRTIQPLISQSPDKRALTLVYGLMVGSAAGLALLFKFNFFRFVFDTTPST
ncbi:hypothetical protein HK104_001776 [Borealophlyctis nickersoniae]|nr:hypothetical protein HK104_001776 [Borealophlyctis nickersoniae]